MVSVSLLQVAQLAQIGDINRCPMVPTTACWYPPVPTSANRCFFRVYHPFLPSFLHPVKKRTVEAHHILHPFLKKGE